MSRLLVSKVFLAEFIISPRTRAVITTKRLAPDYAACIVLQVLGGQPRLAEEPKKSRAHHGQEGEYSHDKFAHFFPSMSLKFCDCIACEHRHDCR
jgi:hypothetical protein